MLDEMLGCPAKIPKCSLEPKFIKKLLNLCLIWALPIMVKAA